MPSRKKSWKKPLTLWSRFKKFAFTFELTPKNILKTLIRKRTKAEGRRTKVKTRRQKKAIIYSLSFIGLLVFIGIYLLKDIPFPTKLSGNSFPVSTQIFDRNGNRGFHVQGRTRGTHRNASHLQVVAGGGARLIFISEKKHPAE